MVSHSAQRCLTPLSRRRPLWALVRLAAWLSAAAVVFGLLLLGSLWFAIPFALALVAAGAVWFAVVRRARTVLSLVRRWRLR
ncbi:MAG TPA: hypothetical protein VGH82_00420 [Gaiellaceae bacterium]|jgi:hypothetical protein